MARLSTQPRIMLCGRVRSLIAFATIAACCAFAPVASAQQNPERPTQLPPAPSPADPPTAEELPAGERGDLPGGQQLDAEVLELIRSRIKPINDITLTLMPPDGELPEDYGEAVFQSRSMPFAVRPWPVMVVHWEAPMLVFQPPYWEETPLERYGQTISPKWQPVISGAHFFGTFPIIPYKIGVDHPFDHISTLGYYRPGSPTPCVRQRLPWEWDAALYEAGAWVSGVMIFP